MSNVNEEALKERPTTGNQTAFLAAMDKVPDVAPSEEDTL